MNANEGFSAEYKRYQGMVEERLARLPDPAGAHPRLVEAMRYSLLAGGKRIRPVLVLAAARLAGGMEEEAMPVALAIECIHTYSLIHDDLPCMDNDTLRRGRPTNHVVFGEARALLAGDALLNYAFELLLAPDGAGDPARRLAAAGELALAAGMTGMIGGQAMDIENAPADEARLTALCRGKTAALIRGSLRAGCRVAGGSEALLAALDVYADCVGLAFQMVDDVLDITGDEATLGKNIGSDAEDGKETFATLLTVEGCMTRAAALTEQAKAALAPFEGADFLCALADWLLSRRH